MTESEQKQQLSVAFVHAVSSRSGFTCEREGSDYDSVDVRIGAIGKIDGQSFFESPSIHFQLKATVTDCRKEKHLHFPISIKNYNDLRKRTLNPRYLVVLLLPRDSSLWLEQNEERMISRACAYYLSLAGREAVTNSDSVTIHLPRSNQLTVESLTSLLAGASRRDQT